LKKSKWVWLVSWIRFMDLERFCRSMEKLRQASTIIKEKLVPDRQAKEQFSETNVCLPKTKVNSPTLFQCSGHTFHALGACKCVTHHAIGAWHSLGACECVPTLLPHFFVVLGVCLQISCLGTWEQSSSLYKVFWGLLNLHSMIFPRSSNLRMFLIFRCAWFLRELYQKHPKISMFREEYNYRLKYRKHYVCPKIIGNCPHTPLFCG